MAHIHTPKPTHTYRSWAPAVLPEGEFAFGGEDEEKEGVSSEREMAGP